MRFGFLSSLVVTLLSLAAWPAQAKIVLSEGFETSTRTWSTHSTYDRNGVSTPERWSSLSACFHSGASGRTSIATTITLSETRTLTLSSDDAFSLAGATEPMLTVWSKWDSGGYSGTVEYQAATAVYGAGIGTWTTLGTESPPTADWHQVKIPLKKFAGVSAVIIRIRIVTPTPYSGAETETAQWCFDDIEVDDGIQVIGVTAPAAGVAWRGGTSQTITWTYDGSLSTATAFAVDQSLDAGATWTTMATDLPMTTRTQSWAIPAGTNSASARIRVRAMNFSGADVGSGTSGAFSILSTAPATPTMIAPANGACVASRPTLQWTAVAGASSYTVTITTAAGASLSKPGLTTTTYQLGEGEVLSSAGSPYSWTVVAIDAAGNQSPAAPNWFAVQGACAASTGGAGGSGAAGISGTTGIGGAAGTVAGTAGGGGLAGVTGSGMAGAGGFGTSASTGTGGTVASGGSASIASGGITAIAGTAASGGTSLVGGTTAMAGATALGGAIVVGGGGNGGTTLGGLVIGGASVGGGGIGAAGTMSGHAGSPGLAGTPGTLAPTGVAPSTAKSGSGSGCRVAGSSGSPWPLVFVSLLLAGLRWKRSRKR
jgi:hypothetical protein